MTLPTNGNVGVSANFGASGSAVILTGTRALARFGPRGFSSRRSYCRFQRNTWLAFTPFASAIPATLAAGSSVSFTILSFSSTRRNTRRFRPATTAPSMGPIVGCSSPAVQMERPDAYDAKVTLTLEIQAALPNGVLDENVVRTVSENARTLKFIAANFEDN